MEWENMILRSYLKIFSFGNCFWIFWACELISRKGQGILIKIKQKKLLQKKDGKKFCFYEF